jgi:hypothetical protein
MTAERWAARAGYAWLVVVGACVVAASWTGLVGFASDILDLTGDARYIVPVTLDGLAVTLAFFGLRSVLAGDAAVFPRLLAWAVVGLGAGLNYWHAEVVGQGRAAAIYFGAMTLLVYLTFEVILRQLRRRDLRAQGAVEAPLPRFRLARWARFPVRTFQAWSAAVDLGLTSPGDAIHAAAIRRQERADQQEPAQVLARPETVEAEQVDELTVTETRQVTARTSRNGTVAGRVRELVDEGVLTVDGILAVEPQFSRDTVRKTLARIDAERSSS